MKSMIKMRTIRLALLVSSVSIYAAAQTSPPSQPPPPVPAYGAQNTPILNPDNPPVTSIDEPTLDLRTASRSFIAPAIQVSESADTNGGNELGSSGLESVTRVLGAVDLQQFWQKTDVLMEYLGGGAFYSSPFDVKQLQAFGFEGITRWRTGQVTLHDAFSYLPDGTFSIGTFGGVPGLGLATGGIGGNLAGDHVFGNGQLGAIGTIPRLANTAILDGVQAINPISAITLAGGFSNAHFYDSGYNPLTNPDPLVNSDQITVQAGYARLVSRHDQLGIIYGFQLFQFPQVSGGEVYNHIINARWSHTISGRMSVIISVGPQYTEIEQGSYLSHWSVSGRAQLHYKFAHSSLVATYEKFTSAGSGFFAGADTQAARLGYKRPLGRTWDVFADLGYSHNHRLQPLGGVDAASYDEGSAGAVVRKHLGRDYDFFVAYRFSEVAFNVPTGGTDPCFSGSCGNQTSRHVGTVGIEWHPSPTRIE